MQQQPTNPQPSSTERILKSFDEKFPDTQNGYYSELLKSFISSALETIRQETIDNLFEQTKLHAKDEIENAKVEERQRIVGIIEKLKSQFAPYVPVNYPIIALLTDLITLLNAK